MSKYIKNVNWPWVEIRDAYEGDGTIVINMNEVSGVYDKSDNMYKWGVRWKDGSWLDNFSEEALAELKELVMNRRSIKTSMNIPGGVGVQDYEIEMMHENQTLYDWLNENGQA